MILSPEERMTDPASGRLAMFEPFLRCGLHFPVAEEMAEMVRALRLCPT